jgi:hypothetical protein
MTSYQEFRFVTAQLEWLERQLRAQPLAVDITSMQNAMDALACARAVIEELVSLGDKAETPTEWIAPVSMPDHISLQGPQACRRYGTSADLTLSTKT